jgi:hypothetical protein
LLAGSLMRRCVAMAPSIVGTSKKNF